MTALPAIIGFGSLIPTRNLYDCDVVFCMCLFVLYVMPWTYFATL